MASEKLSSGCLCVCVRVRVRFSSVAYGFKELTPRAPVTYK